MTHTVKFVIDGGGQIMPVFACHDAEAPCHFICPQNCEQIHVTITAGSGTQIVEAVDQNGHALERRANVCSFVEWMEAVDDPFEHYVGSMTGNLVQSGPVVVNWTDSGEPQWTLARSLCVSDHTWGLAEDGYTRTWSIHDADGDKVDERTDFIVAYDDTFMLEAGSGDYWLECKRCLERIPYAGEVDWR